MVLYLFCCEDTAKEVTSMLEPHHCGRMTDHAPHEWHGFRAWYSCSGRVAHEGGHRGAPVRVLL